MPLFLRGPWLTSGAVFICFLAAVGMTVFWIYTLAENWRYPTLLTKVVAVFAMLLQILFAAQSLATAHSVHKKIRKISFGLFATLGVISITLDMLWFGMFVSCRGFSVDHCMAASAKGDERLDEMSTPPECEHHIGFIGLSVAIFASAVWRLLALIVACHFNVRWNSDKVDKQAPATPASTTISVNSASKLRAQSLPKGQRHSQLPSIAVSQHSDDEELQLFPAESGKLRAKDFEVSSDSNLDSEEDLEMEEDARRRTARSRYDV